jgi:hypothetical protein
MVSFVLVKRARESLGRHVGQVGWNTRKEKEWVNERVIETTSKERVEVKKTPPLTPRMR